MGNCNNCMVPENDLKNQYLTQSCNCTYTSRNFNEGLANGRLTKLEVDNTLARLDQHMDHKTYG